MYKEWIYLWSNDFLVFLVFQNHHGRLCIHIPAMRTNVFNRVLTNKIPCPGEAWKLTKTTRGTNKGTWLFCASNHRCYHSLIKVSVGLKAFPPNFPFQARHSVTWSLTLLCFYPPNPVTLEFVITTKTEDVEIVTYQLQPTVKPPVIKWNHNHSIVIWEHAVLHFYQVGCNTLDW